MFPVEAFQTTLEKAVKIFDSLGIRYHLTGGITSGLYGEPRMTQDIDSVADHDALTVNLPRFFSLLQQANFLYAAEMVASAVKQRGMFQVFDNDEALKLDIYPRELIAGELSRSLPRAAAFAVSSAICINDEPRAGITPSRGLFLLVTAKAAAWIHPRLTGSRRSSAPGSSGVSRSAS